MRIVKLRLFTSIWEISYRRRRDDYGMPNNAHVFVPMGPSSYLIKPGCGQVPTCPSLRIMENSLLLVTYFYAGFISVHVMDSTTTGQTGVGERHLSNEYHEQKKFAAAWFGFEPLISNY